jgi:hypothetical protein
MINDESIFGNRGGMKQPEGRGAVRSGDFVMPVEVQYGLVKLIALAEAMCSTFDDLGNTSMARLSAREFAPYYRKKLKRVVKKYGLPFGHNYVLTKSHEIQPQEEL